MITKQDITKMAKHVFKRGNNIPDKKIMHPKREWAVIVIIAVIALFAFGTFSAERFLYFLHLEENLSEKESSVTKINRDSLDNTLKRYQDRAVQFADITGTIVPALEISDLVQEDDSATTTDEGVGEQETDNEETNEEDTEEADDEEEEDEGESSGGGLSAE